MTPVTETRPILVWGPGVKMLRSLKNITQAQLAAQAGTTQSRISEIENGSRAVADILRVRIARALEVDPYDLFPYVDPEDAR